MPEPVIDRTWPIAINTLRKALGLKVAAEGVTAEGDPDELALFAQAACELIDRKTGRDKDPERHTVTVGDEQVVPIIFISAARETAKLWWQQAKNGPRGNTTDPDAQLQGPPMGAALPRKVEGWLAPYPAPPGFGQPITEAE